TDGVADGALDVEVERVAELVGLGVELALVPHALALQLVTTHLVVRQLLEQVVERVLPDAADATRRELEAALLVLDEAGLLEHPCELGHALEAARRVAPEELAGPVQGDLG